MLENIFSWLLHIYCTGLGIRSFYFRANRSFFVQKRANERFAQKNEQFTHSLIFVELIERFPHIAHFLWATWANPSSERPERIPLSQFFFSDSLIHSFLVSEMSDLLTSLISSERPERIAHGHSFPLSDLSDSLMVAHLSWAIWANRSQSLIWF